MTEYNIIMHTGAIVISKLLMNSSMIQELWMSDNNIGDDGITAIATAINSEEIPTKSYYYIIMDDFTVSTQPRPHM